MLKLNEIRSIFLEYFRKYNHTIIPSSPLIPKNDPSLMFTTAGMVQFKNLFTGIEKAEYKKATSSQKCVRAGGKHNDLENVGYTYRHHTFFEMLGNFSFGDYFKEEAISLAWSFLTTELNISKDRLYVTIYHNDDESYKIWSKLTGFSDNKIIRISTNDNFWSAGDTGPCGPCSEIFYDHGDHIFGGLPGTKDQDGDRFVEIWNLVFMQFEQFENERKLLPKPSIDTGMGLERISAVIQNSCNNYEIDLFKNIIDNIVEHTKIKISNENISSYRVIADHLRSCAFLIADGVMPSNENRGYVLRRIIRRASRHINQLGYKKPLMHELTSSLIDNMGVAYPELIRAKNFIDQILNNEEEKFKTTLDKGLKLLNSEVVKIQTGNKLSGETIFKLYDTYGFPIDLTRDILKREKIDLDEEKFNELMQKQKSQARVSWIGSGEKSTDVVWYDINQEIGATDFLGYELTYSDSIVKAIVIEGKIIEKCEDERDDLYIIVNQTPFYAESGGQMGDRGFITSDSVDIEVLDTKKYLNLVIHHCKIIKGKIKKNDIVKLQIDVDYRNKLRANHSATHLLHSAVRKILGDHISQKGSLVSSEKLRFDINHLYPITLDEKIKIEHFVNELIIKNFPVSTVLTSSEKAIESGALALFGEKYDKEVRVVSIGDEGDGYFSTELCGGTHVNRTGDIGLFKIIAETSIAAGIRRIEAFTGLAALEYIQKDEHTLNSISRILKSNKYDSHNKLEQLLNDKRKLEKSLLEAKKSTQNNNFSNEKIGSINLFYHKIDHIPVKELRNIAQNLTKNNRYSIAAIFSINDDKISFVVSVGNDLTHKLNAIEIAKEISLILGGSGAGGREDLAQAGGNKIDNIDVAIEKIRIFCLK